MKLPAKYSDARKALAAAVRIDEVKNIRDKALAMEVYAFQVRDPEMTRAVVELKRRATRRIGELIEEHKVAGKLAKGTRGQLAGKKKGTSKGRRGSSSGVTKPRPNNDATLEDQGVDKNLAKRARAFAAMPAAKFEAETKQAVGVAVASVLGHREVVKAARVEQQKAKAVKRAQREATLAGKQRALPEKKYGVIVADPEWKDEVWGEETGQDRSPENHYPTSAAEIIAARPVASIAASDCTLWLYTTNQHLRIAIWVLETWGFTYKSHYVWDKITIGTGRWNRSRHELLLIGTIGEPPCPAQGTQWESLISEKKTKHSAKPERFLEMIEGYYPNLPKIELNRRGPARPGWDAWGNESEAAPPAEAAE